MIEDGVTGLLAPKENPKILGEIIRRVVTDPNFARKLGNAGRQVFLERFTHQMNLKNLEDIYGKVVSNYQRP